MGGLTGAAGGGGADEADVQLWSVATWQSVAHLFNPPPEDAPAAAAAAVAVAFSPDGLWAASCGGGGVVRLWDIVGALLGEVTLTTPLDNHNSLFTTYPQLGEVTLTTPTR
eukprot:1192541-Prorocentrum_minimum.AAC.2